MDPKRIIIVEDNESQRRRLVRFLSKMELKTDEAPTLSSGITRVLKSPGHSLAVIGVKGLDSPHIEKLHLLREKIPALGVILLTETGKDQEGLSLLQKDIVDHIHSPSDWLSLYSAVKNELTKKDLLSENAWMREKVRSLSAEQKVNKKRALDLEEIYDTTIENLMTALDIRDVETFGHSRTVARYSQYLAQLLGISSKTALDTIRKGALLHDVGKIAIPDAILKKPASLSAQEWRKIKLHPSLGYGLIKEIKSLREVGDIILYHHERYDGTGYPKNLKGETIPFEARIFALSDALDAITSPRPYREKRDFATAKKEIQDNTRTQFDPVVVEAFCSVPLDKWEKIRFETTKLFPSFEEMLELTRE